MTRDENRRLLYAMFLDVVTNLSRLRRRGLWTDHPDELREKAREIDLAGGSNTEVFTVWSDWAHSSVDCLIRTCNDAEGWSMDRGNLVRAAKLKSERRGRTDDWVKEMREDLEVVETETE